jgi:hypothetical protein
VVHDSLRNLRLDKRLLRRRDWIPAEELERALSELPDLVEAVEWTRPEEPGSKPGEAGDPEA